MEILIAAVVVAATFAVGEVLTWLADRLSIRTTGEDEAIAEAELLDESILTETDQEMARETERCISRCFGEPATVCMMQMDAQQRIDKSAELIESLCRLYHISVSEVVFFREQSGYCGAYSRKNHTISLNAAYLMANDAACLLEFLDTIVHELRHAVQWSIISGENTAWHTPEEIQQSWYNNLTPSSHYISPNRNRKKYRYQPVERDAATFAHAAVKGVQ